MSQTLYIMQGVPGSGKSSLAEKLQYIADIDNSAKCCWVVSTDDYFMEDGVYKFDPKKLGENHKKCYNRTIEFLSFGDSVVVDNTNIHAWEAREYVRFAVSKGIPVVFIRVTGDFKSTHNVPQATIDRMKQEIEDLSVEKCLRAISPFDA